jgi:hypothetical protein
MNRLCWWLVERLSRRLEPGEKDAVLGDIAESGETGREALRDLLGFALRRKAASLAEVWREARSWLALAGLIAPVGMLAGGWSSWDSWLGYVNRQINTVVTQGVLAESAMTRTDDILRLVGGILLIVGWAAAAGYVLGSLLRRRAWAYAAGACALLWLGRSAPILVLFPIPFLWGVRRGARSGALGMGRAGLLAVAIATLTLILQVEDSRAALARELWSNGGSLGWQLVWTPQVMPFLAILWQFGILTLAKEKNI